MQRGFTGQFPILDAILGATTTLVGATGVTQVWVNLAAEVAESHHKLASTCPDRFLLGLGVGHASRVEPAGHQYERPMHKLVSLLNDLDAAEHPVPATERVIAALGPKALALASTRAAGTHPRNVTPDHTATARAAIGPSALLFPAVTAAEVAAGVDVLIVSTPFQQLTALKPIISEVANDITVVDTSNFMPVSDEPGQYGARPVEAIDKGQPESAWLQEQWGRPVIRAWSGLSAHMLAEKGKARGEPGRLAIPVAGDSAEGKQLVMGLVEDTGFDAVDAGTIAESWRLQFGTPAYATELTADELHEALGLADRGAAPKSRDAMVQIVSTWQGPVASQDWLPPFRAAARFPRGQ